MSKLFIKDPTPTRCKWNIGNGNGVDVLEDFWHANLIKLRQKVCELWGKDDGNEVLASLFPHKMF